MAAMPFRTRSNDNRHLPPHVNQYAYYRHATGLTTSLDTGRHNHEVLHYPPRFAIEDHLVQRSQSNLGHPLPRKLSNVACPISTAQAVHEFYDILMAILDSWRHLEVDFNDEVKGIRGYADSKVLARLWALKIEDLHARTGRVHGGNNPSRRGKNMSSSMAYGPARRSSAHAEWDSDQEAIEDDEHGEKSTLQNEGHLLNRSHRWFNFQGAYERLLEKLQSVRASAAFEQSQMLSMINLKRERETGRKIRETRETIKSKMRMTDKIQQDGLAILQLARNLTRNVDDVRAVVVEGECLIEYMKKRRELWDENRRPEIYSDRDSGGCRPSATWERGQDRSDDQRGRVICEEVRPRDRRSKTDQSECIQIEPEGWVEEEGENRAAEEYAGVKWE